jgi:AraC-like DNA-binding protein
MINNNSSSGNLYYSPSILKVLKTQKYMTENPAKSHSISSLSADLDISPPWLSNIFKNFSGISLSDFSTKIKLFNALWELVSTEKQIKTIALDLGYEPLYFSNKFRTLFGVTPSDIRKDIFDVR